jgi:hypothetical protein
MGTKSREVIWGGRIGAAKINAEHARQRAKQAAREADRAEAYAWSVGMEADELFSAHGVARRNPRNASEKSGRPHLSSVRWDQCVGE